MNILEMTLQRKDLYNKIKQLNLKMFLREFLHCPCQAYQVKTIMFQQIIEKLQGVCEKYLLSYFS